MEVLAYHLEDLRVPLVIRVSQVGNPCCRETRNSRKLITFYLNKTGDSVVVVCVVT